jgi:FkbM family methyltransferase
MFRRLRKLARLSKIPSYRRGLSLGVAAGIENERFLKSHSYRTILDVGANKGQFSLVALASNPAARIIAFEPIGHAAKRFRRLHSRTPNVSLLEIGLGDENGDRIFHISKRDDSSSFLPIASALRDLNPGTEEAYTTTFPVRRLDDVLREQDLVRPCLLKLDVQGFELEVLKGAIETLKRVDSIYSEVSFVELYEGQPLASDIILWLDSHGFKLDGVYYTSFDRTGRSTWGDMHFSPKKTECTDSHEGTPI